MFQPYKASMSWIFEGGGLGAPLPLSVGELMIAPFCFLPNIKNKYFSHELMFLHKEGLKKKRLTEFCVKLYDTGNLRGV